MRATPTIVELVLLALWLGGAVLFAAVVAPALFAALPTRTLAGVVVGRVLPAVFYSGMLVAVAAILLEWRAAGEWNWRGRAAGGVIMLVSCAIAQLVISPRIERVRADIGGVIDNLAVDDPRRAEFGRLHGASVAWLGLAMLCAAAIAVLAARSLRTQARSERDAMPGLTDD